MPELIPIQYHRLKYPVHIQPTIREVAGHFDIQYLRSDGNYSIHTEYSYGPRKFNTDIIQKYPVIINANASGIPKLWFNACWADEFSMFILSLVGSDKPCTLIEIHPPFSDYIDMDTFLEHYLIFYETIYHRFPETEVLLENRSGSMYRSGHFIVSNIQQLVALSEKIDSHDVPLKLTLDLPQLFTTHEINPGKKDQMVELFHEIKKIRHNIAGLHLWGKKVSASGRRIAHIGDLNDYFMGMQDIKSLFLQHMADAFDDDILRYFVPEVNSQNDDLHSIIRDLEYYGFTFI
jgi:hypothetical protein